MDTPQNRTSEVESSSCVLLILEIVPPQHTRGCLYEDAAYPTLDDIKVKIKDIRRQIKDLEHVEESLKDKYNMDSEEVRIKAKAWAIETGHFSEWYTLEKLHGLRLNLSKLLKKKTAFRTAVYLS
ncbi:hypothetical protein ARMSODRAFT_1021265 [Armillaria solidipes]|uniref:Uncharacterized protein n=1 Tax=Armillaria solidipes TaxID=1076256 RepID=A0A2H3BD68_9AGAR|nr:hypothetical protein ARMSODRAFT_1021265 [Armillaria solidipes]